jgi:hypothetical protein
VNFGLAVTGFNIPGREIPSREGAERIAPGLKEGKRVLTIA